MVTHVITKDGRLMLDRGHNEEVPQAERRYPNAKPGTFESMCGIIRRVPKYEDAKHHGVVTFYGNEGDPNSMGEPNSDYRWHEYNAKFTDGRLVGIDLAEDE